MTKEEVARPQSSDWEQTKQVIGLILIHLQGHPLPLSLAELREMTGLRKSVLLRALAAAERRGEVVQVAPFQWQPGTSG